MSDFSDSSDLQDEIAPLQISFQNNCNTNDLHKSQAPTSTGSSSERGFNKFLKKHKQVKKIGEGNNGSVHLYRSIGPKQKEYAVKKIPLSEETQLFLTKNFKEMCCLHNVPNLVKYYKMYLDQNMRCFYLIMQYFNFPHLKKQGHYSENVLKGIIKKILQCLKALHKKQYYHRDIKPDNILYDEKSKQLVIVDLGICRRVKDIMAHTKAGTPSYMAPEMNITGYNHKVDIWALGITIYEMVCGLNPFYKKKNMVADNMQYLLKMEAMNGEIDFSSPQWNEYSPILKGLVKKMLCFNPKQRYDATQCLNHIWFIEQSKIQCDGQQDLDKPVMSEILSKSRYNFFPNRSSHPKEEFLVQKVQLSTKIIPFGDQIDSD